MTKLYDVFYYGLVAVGCGIYFLQWAIIGLLGLFINRRYKQKFAALSGWPSVPGQIHSAGLSAPLGELFSRKRYPSSPAVTYEYTVAGKDYVAHATTLSSLFGPVASQKFIQQHPPGSPVTVYYDPADPSDAYLDRDTPPSPLWRIGGLLSLVVSLPGCLGLVFIPILISAGLMLSSAAGVPPVNLAAISSLAFRPDGQVLASGGCGQYLQGSAECVEGAVYLWDVSNPSAARLLGSLVSGGSALVNSVAYNSDGAILAGIGEGDAVFLLNVAKPARPQPVGVPFGTNAVAMRVAFSPDGKTLAAGNYQNEVQLWDVSDPAAPSALGKPLAELPGPASGLAFSPDGKMLAVESTCLSSDLNACPAAITLWDLTSLAAPRPLASPFGDHANYLVAAVAFSQDSKMLAAAVGDKSVGLWDLSNPSAPRQLGAPLAANGFIQGLAFRPDGKILAAGDSSLVTLWDVSNPQAAQPASTIFPATLGVDGLAYSPNSPTLALISNGKIYLWDVSNPASPRAVGKPLVPPVLATPR